MATMVLRLFARCESESDARGIAGLVENRLRDIGRTTVVSVQRYWKLAGHQEILVEIEAASEAENAYTRCLEELGTGWSRLTSELDSVWNPGDGDFVHASVAWAHLECISEHR